MEEIKAPKKERKFLKAMGEVALTLVRELLLNAGKKLINKSGNKRQGLVLAFIILASTFAIAQYPSTGNKQRLGYQTSGDGLVYRGRSNDTTTIKSSGLNNAYHIYDTINNVLYSYVKTKGGWVFSSTGTVIINNNFTQPVDSLFFNVGVPTDNVDTAKMRWDSNLATVVLGLNDNVANELGFKNFWLVKNQTGSTITKGSLVYANGTLGASGRITVAKFIANGSIDAKYLLGMTAHDLSNGEDGYVISFGKIRKVNTDTFAAGAILYPSPTVEGVWTDVEPIAPNIDMPIGFCINSHVNNGTIAIRVASGYKLSELHDLAISSPIDRASLYYRDGLWRDTTAALLTSDTASLSNRINLKLNIADTASMLTPYFKDADTTSLNLTSRFAAKLNISDTLNMLVPYLRKADTTLMLSKYLMRADTSLLNLTSRFNTKLNISDTSNMLVPYLRKADTTNMLSPYFRDADTSLLNLTSRFAAKQNTLNGTGFVKANGTNISFDNSSYLRTGLADSSYLKLTGGTLTGGLTGTTGTFISNNVPQLSLGISGISEETRLAFVTGSVERFKIFSTNSQSSITFQSPAQASAARGYRFISSYNTDSHLGLVQDPRGNVGIKSDATGNDVHPNTLYVNGTLGVTGATTIGSTLAVTGALTGTTGTFTGLNVTNPTTEAVLFLRSANFNFPTKISFGDGASSARQEIIKPTSTSNLQFRSYPTGTGSGGYEFYVSNGSTESLAATIGTDKSLSLTGTLGVTGAATLSNLAGTGSRMVVAGSGGLLSTQAISTGTVTSVGGMGTVNGISLTGTVTSSGNLTLGGTLSGVSLSSQVSGTLPIANGGTNAATISQARTNLQVPNIATTITPQAPLTGGGSLAGDRTISIPVATSVANGYLSSTDWSTFNGKQNAITLTTTGTSGAATLTGATLNIPQYSGGSGTVTNITVTSPLTITNPTTTPLIQINAANGTSSSGVVTTGTQQFGGAKTFNDNLRTNGNMTVDGTLNVDLKATFASAIKATSLERNVVNTTGTSITLGIATTWLNIHQSSNFTVTLPSAATYPGKEIHIRNSAGGVVLSASSNIIDMAVSHAGSTTTIIMAGGTAGQFTTLVSDGTNWIQTQLDNN